MSEKGSQQHTQPGAMPKGGAMGGGMPTPSMGAAGGDTMPRPGQTGGATGGTGAADSMPRPGAQGGGGGGMPRPAGMGGGGGGGGDIPRFVQPGRPSGPQYEPGVVEVQFRDGVQPSLSHDGTSVALSLQARSAGPDGVGLDAVNQILQRYCLVSAEPTFNRTLEEGDSARATALQQGIDVPHLADFVTLRFPPDADVTEIAAELCSSPQVARAVPVPTARPPIDVLDEAPPRAARQDDPLREGAGGELSERPRDREGAPAGPLSEPLVGSSDQAVIDPNTGLENQWYIFRCRANHAWSMSSGANVVIADVDWGYRTGHEDLAPHLAKTYNAVDGSGTVNTGGSIYHGTGVLGLTGAVANGKGMAGFGFDSELWGIQGDTGPGAPLGGNAWARGIDWVRTTNSGGKRKIVILEVQTGAFGNYEQVPSVNAAIKTAIAAGVVVCVAAGNGDRDAGIDDAGNPIPATGSILVGATAYDPVTNPRAWFSNFGPNIVVAAPGDSDHDVTCHSASDSSYSNHFGGTSGATPKVAGVAALMLSANPSLTHAQVRDLLNSTGSLVTTTAGKPLGRFLNAEAAVRAARSGVTGRMEVFARGTDKAVWHLWQTAPSNGWSGWASLGGWVDIIRSARNADGRLEVFARGADKAVWHRWQTAPNNGWSDWHSLGGWVDLIEVGQNQDGRLEIFARGSDRALWHRWQTAPSNGWSEWASMGGWIDRLSIGQNQDGRIEVFARGGDGALWHNWQTAPNNGWSGWASMGGWIDMIDVGRNQDGRLEVFARGSDAALWHIWQTAPNNGWSSWNSLGGWIDQIAVGQNLDGRLEVFARGSDKAVWHRWQTAPNNGWSNWNSLGGWVDRLFVSNNADGRMELFARGADKALWHRWQTAPNNGWSNWGSLGGVIDSVEVGQNAG
ncbi:S8 family serine peptidase [Telluria aromaticivorans]|uniref:S8 family serine peptidase n=1 Tax=Telluria aromaticivorans TaxID=2725995 RepID=A0A7Y2K0K3_9BURK|nr:S8 family serine peptidase [Telluria aromaticivorans]NNG23209.1 S8 family serine peptidase [Telluria aromaticivorans]